MTLSFADAEVALLACVKAGVTALVVGPPGIGKTALVRAVAAQVDLPCHELLASNCDATDVAGIPHVVDGTLQRALIAPIKACVTAPGLLFLDELTSVPPSVQAPLMRLLLERYAGDHALHPASRILAAANPPEQCPGGIELSAATVNRIVKIDDFSPTLDEVRAYFNGLAPDTPLGEEARDFAATLAVEPGLLDLTPPAAAVDAGAPFASPRAWELGLRAFAEHGKEDDVGYAVLTGAVGEKATAFLGIRALRSELPSVDEIRAAPNTARVPDQRDRQIAAVGLLARVADADAWPAWIYARRLQPEIAAACGRLLFPREVDYASPWVAEGRKAQIALLARVGKQLGDRCD